MVIGHAFAARISADWIIDSGATSHIMCTSIHLFTDYRHLHKSEKVSLGDGRHFEAVVEQFLLVIG